MARTLTNLIPVMYAAMDTVSRELAGFIPAVSLDANYARAAIGQSVYAPASAAATAGNVTAAVTPPDDGDNTPTAVPVTISKARRCAVRINGEQQLGLGPVWDMLRPDEFAQAMRTLVNEIEADLAATYVSASRAIGTAGTAPFGTPKLGDAAALESILDDNGAPRGDRSLIINSPAKESLALLTGLTSVADAGSPEFLRQGIVGEIFGLNVRKSAQIKQHTAGVAADYLVDLGAGYPVGTTTVHIDTGTGATVAGDVVSFADDPSGALYVVKTGATGDGDKDIVLGAPGLRGAIVDGKAMTTAAAHACNLAFSRNAIKLATRAPAVPVEGDMAVDALMLTDPVTGLSFEVREYRQYRQVQYEISIAWGVAAVKPEHMAVLMG